MITLKLKKVPVLFVQGFSREDTRAIVDFVLEANQMATTFKDTVLFIDTPATPHLVEAVECLKTEGLRVVFRDHHRVSGESNNIRDNQKLKATEKLERLLGDDCLITYRDLHPACSTLVEPGEFADALAIIADPDADGLTAAMKAAGIHYPELDDDAALLDSEPAMQVKGSRISRLLALGLSTLPSYDSARPREREACQQRLFSDWVQAVQGNEEALQRLQETESIYEAAVKVAGELADKARTIAPGTVLVDATESEIFDMGSLTELVERNPDNLILVLVKDRGPIAAHFGVQYSLSVSRQAKDDIDLRRLLPEDVVNDPACGVISNVPFLLHVSEPVWSDYVLPGLKDGKHRL